MIIILSGADDPTADRVASELARRSARYARLDLSDFPQRVVASPFLDGSGRWTGQIRHAQGWAVAWEDITAMYYRCPSNFQPPSGLTGADRRFVVAEARGGFGGVLASLDAQWVNHPFRVADSEFKPIQLIAAQACGFAVPATVITNDGRSAHSFAGSRAHDVVYKPLGGGFYRDNDDNVTLIGQWGVHRTGHRDADRVSYRGSTDRRHHLMTTIQRTDVPTSSSTRPSLMARMPEVLQLRDGMRVLEIGTGTGYNVGLLTHRLGNSHVTSIDIEPALIDHARRRLHSLNLTPHLLSGDGIAGVADRAPFDR